MHSLLGLRALGYLKHDWLDNSGKLLFCTRRETAFANADVVEYQLHPIMDELAIPRPPRMGLHALRHGNATVLDSQNVPIAVRKGRLGHSSFSTTMRYTHVVGAEDRQIAEELGRIFDPSSPKQAADSLKSAA